MTDLIRTALERIRAAFRPHTRGRHSRPTTPQGARPALATRLSADVVGARLAVARRRRQEYHAPPAQAGQPQPRADWFTPDLWEYTGPLVRPYVAALGDPVRKAGTSTQADPWRDAR